MSSSEKAPTVRIGNECPRNGKATVSVEVVMTEAERNDLLERVTDGETPLDDRVETIEALGVAPEE